MAKKQATKKKQPLAARAGNFLGRHGPGAAKKLGRATKRGATGVQNAAQVFSKNFMRGLRES